MKTDLPRGVLIKVETIKERCGNCLKPFIMETYLDTLTDKRTHRIRCDYCQYVVPQDEDY
jgi:DNA-directed RNA polymerase subunit RPC12/RpoP